MLSMQLIEKLTHGGTVLCLGAHSDDIEIGCGGTMNLLARLAGDLSVHWVVFSASGQRKEEARSSARDMLKDVSKSEIIINEFRNGYFPYVGAEIKDYFESLKDLPNPDIIFTHYQHDLHQDHRLISELTRNTFRDHLIVEYEIPKYDGDLGSPNAFVALEEQDLDRKLSVLNTHFKSQQAKQWFTSDTFSALCRLRGIECNSRSGLAEAFYCSKLVLI